MGGARISGQLPEFLYVLFSCKHGSYKSLANRRLQCSFNSDIVTIGIAIMEQLYRDPFSLTAAVILILSLICVPLPTTCASGDGVNGDEVDPVELARILRAEICAKNASQIQEFYRKIRNEENRTVSFPDPSMRWFDH